MGGAGCNLRRKRISLPRGFCPLNCYPGRSEQLLHGECNVIACKEDRQSKKEEMLSEVQATHVPVNLQ